MRRLLYIIIGVIALCVVSTGCENKALNRQLDDLDTLMRVRPDSVYAVLDSMDTHSMSKHQRMRHALLLADAQNKAYIDFTTDSAMLEVADYFDHHGTPNEQMRAHYLLGCTYRDMGDVPMELQCFLDATEKADTASKDCDLYTLYAIYGQMADIYDFQFLPQEELKALAMCKELAKKDGDVFSAIKAYELQIRAYETLNKIDSVISVALKTRELYLRNGFTQHAAKVLVPIINIMVEMKEFQRAKQYIQIFESESNCIKENTEIKGRENIYYYCKGKYYIENNQNDSAIICFRKLINTQYDEAAYKGLLTIYEKNCVLDSIAKYAKLYAQANDSSYLSINSKFVEQMTASYNYSRQEQIAKRNLLEKEKEKEKNLILIITLISILLIVSVIAFFAHNRYKDVKLEHARKEDILYKSYNNTLEKIKVLEQEMDKYAFLRNTNEENITKLQQLQKEIEEYKKDKEQLIKKLEHLGNNKIEIDFKAWLEKFQQDSTFTILWEKLIKVKPDDNNPLSRKVWNDVYYLFVKKCPRFISFIESPEKELNDLDKKAIMLGISGFKTGDVAILLGKSKQQISNIHSRIKTKLYPNLDNTHLLKKELLTTLRKSLE